MTAAPAHSLEARYYTDPQLHAREFGGSGVVFPHRLPFAGKAVREVSGAVCRNRHSPSVKVAEWRRAVVHANSSRWP